ncbi:MAG: FRG domain-containing protein [Chloroflexi bacterium]|nr:FRG domain-containing protein [Chloroflexota bacterium]
MLMDNQYTTQEIKTFTDFVNYDACLPNAPLPPKWIFRGQKCEGNYSSIDSARIDLMPSLERVARSFGLQLKEMPCIECWSLREFKRRLHQYTADLPGEDDKLEWLALMQHHGAPTRLLDWTYSFFVAAYFAVQPSEHCDAEVWALNACYFGVDRVISKSKYEEITGSVECVNNDPPERTKDRSILLQNGIVNHLWKNPEPCVCAVNPLRLNERLTIQQGVFLYPGDLTVSFEDNLSAGNYLPKSNLNLIRFRIDANLRKKILEWLYRFNITEATLFPGLDGFARSFATRLGFLPAIQAELRCGSVSTPEQLSLCCGRVTH